MSTFPKGHPGSIDYVKKYTEQYAEQYASKYEHRFSHMADAFRYEYHQEPRHNRSFSFDPEKWRGRDPIKLEWAGWHSDTRELARHGWEFAESRVPAYDHGYDHRHIQFRHRDMDVVGESARWSWHPHMSPDEQRHRMRNMHLHVSMYNRMQIMKQEMHPQAYIGVDPMAHSAWNAPREVFNETYFKPLDYDAKKIFLEKASMADILEIALSKQAPQQEVIRKKMIDRQEYEASQVKAELRLVS